MRGRAARYALPPPAPRNCPRIITLNYWSLRRQRDNHNSLHCVAHCAFRCTRSNESRFDRAAINKFRSAQLKDQAHGGVAGFSMDAKARLNDRRLAVCAGRIIVALSWDAQRDCSACGKPSASCGCKPQKYDASSMHRNFHASNWFAATQWHAVTCTVSNKYDARDMPLCSECIEFQPGRGDVVCIGPFLDCVCHAFAGASAGWPGSVLRPRRSISDSISKLMLPIPRLPYNQGSLPIANRHSGFPGMEAGTGPNPVGRLFHQAAVYGNVVNVFDQFEQNNGFYGCHLSRITPERCTILARSRLACVPL